MKIGDVVPSRQESKPCTKCGDAVFKTFKSGFYIISSQVVGQTANGFRIRDHWKCPACGHSEAKFHERTPSGLRIPQRVNSSDKSKKKRRYHNVISD